MSHTLLFYIRHRIIPKFLGAGYTPSTKYQPTLHPLHPTLLFEKGRELGCSRGVREATNGPEIKARGAVARRRVKGGTEEQRRRGAPDEISILFTGQNGGSSTNRPKDSHLFNARTRGGRVSRGGQRRRRRGNAGLPRGRATGKTKGGRQGGGRRTRGGEKKNISSRCRDARSETHTS